MSERNLIRTPITYSPRLSGSENHKGFNLRDRDGLWLGEISPLDEDGIAGEEMCKRIVRAVNCHEELVAALRSVRDLIEPPTPKRRGRISARAAAIRDLPLERWAQIAVHEIDAALAKAEER